MAPLRHTHLKKKWTYEGFLVSDISRLIITLGSQLYHNYTNKKSSFFPFRHCQDILNIFTAIWRNCNSFPCCLRTKFAGSITLSTPGKVPYNCWRGTSLFQKNQKFTNFFVNLENETLWCKKTKNNFLGNFQANLWPCGTFKNCSSRSNFHLLKCWYFLMKITSFTKYLISLLKIFIQYSIR